MTFDAKKRKMVIYTIDGIKNAITDNPSQTQIYEYYLNTFIPNCIESGINVVIFSFISGYVATPTTKVLYKGAAFTQWFKLSPQQRSEIKSKFSNGVILISMGGAFDSNDITTLAKVELPILASNIISFCKNNLFDGVDFDYESNDSVSKSKVYTTLIPLFKSAKLLVTIAPQAGGVIPSVWFTEMWKQVGSKIDWINIQYYNQTSDFTKYEYTMTNQVNGRNSAILQLITGKVAGVQVMDPIEPYKILVSACGRGDDVDGACSSYPGFGWMDLERIVSFIQKASDDNRFSEWLQQGGLMYWQYDGRKKNNDNMFKMFKLATEYFNKNGPPGPPYPPSPPKPFDNCKGILCGEYGECVDGNCKCNYGYSGNNCEIAPSCSGSSFLSSLSFSPMVKKSLIITGILFIIFGIVIIPLSIRRIIRNRNSNKIAFGGLIIGILFLCIGYFSSSSTKKNYYWETETWGQCVNNTKTRDVYCKNENGIVDDSKCTGTKPSTDSSCGESKKTYNWDTETWSQCVNNTKTRDVYCKDKNNIVEDSKCTGTKPSTDSYCGESKKTYNWDTDMRWEKCINGIQTRGVYCHDEEGNNADDSKCTGTKPKTQQSCSCNGKSCSIDEICLQKNGSPGTTTLGMCVPCKHSVKPTGKANRRMVTYIQGWDNPTDVQYGTLKNYTHVCLAFGVPYHFYGGYCSGKCSLWLAWYFDSDPNGKGITDVKNVIKTIRNKNPNTKILFSLGGWNLNHFKWNGRDGESGVGCGKVCNPPDGVKDNPACYGPWGSLSGTYPECPPGIPDKVYNCKQSDEHKQPAEYCYGPGVDQSKYVGDQIIDIVKTLGLDGFDFDLEDTCDFFETESYGLKFMVDLTKYVRSKSSMILSQAPINAYMITDPTLNKGSYSLHEGDNATKCAKWQGKPFTILAKNYTDHLIQIKDDLDFISVQFYNGAPFSSTQPEDVIKAYNQVVTLMGGPKKVVVGMCSYAEDGTCQLPTGCGENCPQGQVRASSIVSKLMMKYGNDFGGVMQWAANGDTNGSFSTPMLTAMGTM
jgi:chitinase